MLQNVVQETLQQFDKKYTNTYNSKYRGMIDVLKEFSGQIF
jgi:hypothetical protein